MPDTTVPVLKGTLDVLVLKALSWQPMHGFGIASWLERSSDGALGIEDSALYQALYRLEGRRLVKPEWGMTEKNRRAKFYQLTEAGRAELRVEAARWNRYAATIGAILAAPAKA